MILSLFNQNNYSEFLDFSWPCSYYVSIIWPSVTNIGRYSSVVERIIGNDEVESPILSSGTTIVDAQDILY